MCLVVSVYVGVVLVVVVVVKYFRCVSSLPSPAAHTCFSLNILGIAPRNLLNMPKTEMEVFFSGVDRFFYIFNTL